MTKGGLAMEILLVEDDEIQALLLKALLLEEGHQVTATGFALEACRLLQRWPFELVVTDLWLPASPPFPRMDAYGWDIAHTATQEGVPVILHSGDEEAAEQAARDGYRFVEKGDIGQLLATVKEVTNAKAA